MGTHLHILGEWAQQFMSMGKDTPDPVDRLDALHRAELKAKVDIRAALDRLAGECDLLDYDIDEAMLVVDDTLDDLLAEAEGELTQEIKGDDRV